MAKKTQSPDPSGPNAMQWGTLVGVVLVGVLAVRNTTAISGLKNLESRMANIDARVSKMQTDVATAAARPAPQPQQRRSGPDPNQVYTFKPAPASMAHGNPSAPITIVEVSDFQ